MKMRKTARIQIIYHTDTVVSFKVRKERKDKRYNYTKYWDDRYSFKFCYNFHDDYMDLPSKEHTLPKLRKEQFHDHEWAFYSAEPRWWRQLFHIKPLRRANKELARKMSVLPTLEVDYNPTGGFDIIQVHPYDNAVEPLYRAPHQYYW